jgi:predicted enzyme related to lactoylglutathione lyase
VDDVDKRCAKAKEAGATILREPFDVEQVGRIAILKQPGGGVVGWITPVAT